MGLAPRLTPLLAADVSRMRQLKAADGALDPTIRAWDVDFYCKRVEELQYRGDRKQVSQYFGLESVVSMWDL